MSTEWPASDLRTNGIRLRSYTLGDGPPLLLLHGIMASALTWGRAAQALAQRHRVIALDQRGHGQSEAPDRGYADQDFVADAAGVMAQLAAPVDVIGHSMGGRIAMQLAVAQPRLVRRLVLEEAISTTNDTISTEKAAQLRSLALAWLEPFRQQPRTEAIAQVQHQSPTWTEEECEAVADSQRGFSLNIFGVGGMDYSFDWRAILPRIQCPTLVLGGDPGMPVFPPAGVDDAAADEARRLLARGTIVRIPNAGHMLHLDQPDLFVEAVEEFLA
jgi:pimeloyl-ACP methyl ester carboxylesterase